MKAHFELKSQIQEFKNSETQSFKSLEGVYLYNDFALYIDCILEESQTIIARSRATIDQERASFPHDTYSNRSREIALRDFLTRSFRNTLDILGISHTIIVQNPGQEILDRTSVFIDSSSIELRFTIQIPVENSKIDYTYAETVFIKYIPKIIESLLFENLDPEEIYNHIKTSEDADFLRNELENLRLIAFVADGSFLARESGYSDLPMGKETSVPFISPDNLKMDVELPNRGQITGMGLPRGITLITGEKNQGKSTLLNAIQQGIYNHIPGDGREFVVSNPNAVKVRSEPGRTVNNVDIYSLLPSLENASSYLSKNAGDIDSQAVNIIESLEVGADVLLIDQDTSAYSFLTHESSVNEPSEDITVPDAQFIDKVKGLLREYMVSTIFTLEKPIDNIYFADFVLRMTSFRAEDISPGFNSKEKESHDAGNNFNFGSYKERVPLELGDSEIINTAHYTASKNTGNKMTLIGNNSLDLRAVEQLVSEDQLKAVSAAINYSRKYIDGKRSLRQVLSLVMLDLGKSGLDILDPELSGQFTEFRKIELAAAINRLYNLKCEFK